MRFYGHLQKAVCFCCFVFLLSGRTWAAEPLPEKSLQLDGKISTDGSTVELSWPKAAKGGSVDIQRRELGQTGKASWQAIASVTGIARVYRDDTVKPGIAYEYRVSRPTRKKIETGYWVTGHEIPAVEKRGTALVVVDETLADDLALHLDRFMLDLNGDGWSTVRHDVPRGLGKQKAVENLLNARNTRAWIRNQYSSNPQTPHVLILIGHVPVVKSGNSNPDGHSPRPLETDLFYADMDGIWKGVGGGVLAHNTIPSDHIEMQVGRIDFSNLGDKPGVELALLRSYFDKNHHWRHGRLGDLREAYGSKKHLFVETNALLNIVGPKFFTKGGHHDTGTQRPWLFGVDFGSWKYQKYITSTPIKSVFTINFGSGKLDFSKKKGRMTVMLAQQWYGLTTGWGARPAWQLHHMALGKSIGYSHLRTVNNGTASTGGKQSLEYTPTGNYTMINPIWVNLLGDPTLRPFPLQPVKNLRVKTLDEGVELSWDKTGSPGEVQYRVYRAPDRSGPFEALNSAALQNDNQFIDSKSLPGAWYMVRAYSLKSVYAGSFYTFSQGRYATVDNAPPAAIDQSISTSKGQAVRIALSAEDDHSAGNLLMSFIVGPEEGLLKQSDDDWTFTPDADFSGSVDIPFTVFDGVNSDTGKITIKVSE